MEMPQVVWKQHLRPRAVVGYGVKIFLPSPPNYVTRSPGPLERIVDHECLDDCLALRTFFYHVQPFFSSQKTKKVQ